MRFTPVPKPAKRLKNRKTAQWFSIRTALKVKFLKMGITTCEGNFELCTRDRFLGFAHAKKRRKLTEDELWEVALLCNNCHSQIEYAAPEVMEAYIKNIIKTRKT